VKGKYEIIFQKSRNQLTILGIIRVTHSKFDTEYPQILGDSLMNLVSWAILRLDFIHPW